MLNHRSTAIAALLSVAGAISAQAATLPAGSSGAAVVSDAAGGSSNISFSWNDAPYSGQTAALTFSEAFDFSFVSYSGPDREQTGFYVSDTLGNRYTNDSDACRNAAWGSFAGACNLVTGSTTPGVLFRLSAGDYSIGVFESQRPASGEIVFNVAAVPLPAGALLLIGALGAFGVAGRRKAATA